MARVLVTAVAVLLLGLIAAFLLGVIVPLDRLRPQIEQAASAALGRTVRIESLSVELAPNGGLDALSLSIGNPAGFSEPEFLRLGHARIRISLASLLSRKIRVVELRAADAKLSLLDRDSGDPNWVIALPTEEPAPEAAEAPAQDSPPFVFDGIDALSIDRLGVRFVPVDGQPVELRLDELRGAIPRDHEMTLSAHGFLDALPFELGLRSDPLTRETQAARADLTVEIAGAKLALSGSFRKEGSEQSPSGVVLPDGSGAAALELELGGERLDSLDPLVRVSLPPLGPWRIAGRLTLVEEGLRVDAASLRVGSSELAPDIRFRRGEPPRLEVRLTSPRIQLDDFQAEGWSAFGTGTDSADAGAAEDAGVEPVPTATDVDESGEPTLVDPQDALISARALARLDARVEVDVEQVMSGEERLGAGSLRLSLEGGRLRLDPLRLDVPGGGVELRGGLGVSGEEIDAYVGLDMSGFDYGVLARRLDPESEASGTLHAAVDLRSRGPIGGEFLAGATGHLAFAVFPENLEAGVFDLWAANLLLAALPRLGPPSEVNCFATWLAVNEGVLVQEDLILDTSSMRVGGRVEVDLTTGTVDVVLAPVSKKPRLFSAATPVRVTGKVEDFSLGVKPRDVAASLFRMAASPLTVPIQRVLRRNLPRDGGEACLATLDRLEAAAPR
ncbi:MAG: AsmA family protein [Myxococcota bacterium]|nr:AsmA family protein [Myxococcota bacterium]